MIIKEGIHPIPQNSGPLLKQLSSFTPGRVNLIGEYTDYNGGMVMPAALELGIKSELSLFNTELGSVICVSRNNSETVEFEQLELFKLVEDVILSGLEKSDAIELPKLSPHHWSRYIAGCVVLFRSALLSRHLPPPDWVEKTISIVLDSSLPQGAGLSSSAALCVSILGQLNILSGIPLDAKTLARLAMLVEHRFAGTHCGLMDQLAVLCSRADHFTRIDFLEYPVSHDFHISYAKAHEAFHNHSLVIFKTGVQHSLAESEYNSRRAACDEALKALNEALGLGAHSLGELARLPRFATISTQAEYLNQLESLLESRANKSELAKRATHAMLENSRVMTAAKALTSGDLQALNGAMRASHQSLDTLYEVTCPELNIACEAVETVVRELCTSLPALALNALIGPRMTGGGFGGSTVQLIHNTLCDGFKERFESGEDPYTKTTGLKPQIIITRPSAGFSAGFEVNN